MRDSCCYFGRAIKMMPTKRSPPPLPKNEQHLMATCFPLPKVNIEKLITKEATLLARDKKLAIII